MIERDIIGIFGKRNAGKSSLMNLLTQQETSIVDPTPGTTADIKITLSEIHGLGPVKIMDTAGCDETSELGLKKQHRSLTALKECDLVLLVINPGTTEFDTELMILKEARELDKQVLLVYNLFSSSEQYRIGDIEALLSLTTHYSSVVLRATDSSFRQILLEFILNYYIPKKSPVELLPFIEKGEFYILNIPMDEETPPGRFLRPQAMAEEYITRKWAFPVSYRMNLREARTGSGSERERWDHYMGSFKKKPKLIITDSQAIDIMKDWAPEDMGLTTFSIMMINYMSRGRLNDFIQGIHALKTIKAGEQILIAEACNHSRIREDIGTVQIPALLEKFYPGVVVNFAFGREFGDEQAIRKYKLVIHCGGCMISNQHMAARLRDLSSTGVPITNYGIFLSFVNGEKTLERVIKPWMDSKNLTGDWGKGEGEKG